MFFSGGEVCGAGLLCRNYGISEKRRFLFTYVDAGNERSVAVCGSSPLPS
jgi:hypothetical protein